MTSSMIGDDEEKIHVMSISNTTSSQSKILDLGDQFEASITPTVPMNLKSAISCFVSIEAKYDQAVQDQDALIRGVTRRIPVPKTPHEAKDPLVPLTLSPTTQAEFRTPGLPYAEFRKAAEVANKVIEKQMPMATKRFMSQAGRYEIDQIEQLEVNITILRQHMRNVELQIMSYTPRSSMDVVLKLKFLTALMLDGGEVETDYFAYLIEECAEVLENDATLMNAAHEYQPVKNIFD